MAFPIALVMAGMTAAKMAQDADREQRDRKLASTTQRYKPWTGEEAQPIRQADMAGTAAQGVAGYMGMEQAMENQELTRKLVDAQIKSGQPGMVSPYAYKAAIAGPVRGYEPEYNQGEAWGETINNPYAMARRGYR